MPLPRLMPRPSISVSDSPLGIDIEDTGVIPTKRQKIKKEKSGSQCSTSSSESLLSPSAKTIAALKRRKRYNQSRPCALKCPECDLPIRDKSRLIEHLRGHTGERYVIFQIIALHNFHGISWSKILFPDYLQAIRVHCV